MSTIAEKFINLDINKVTISLGLLLSLAEAAQEILNMLDDDEPLSDESAKELIKDIDKRIADTRAKTVALIEAKKA